MTDYTISETFTLPSHGKVYEEEINPEITLRSMTTREEMKRLSKSEKPYKLLCTIIDDCTINNLGISSYDMCLGDYQFLLHKLRIVTYGKDYKISSVCPYCGSTMNAVLNLDDLAVKEFDENSLKYSEFQLPKSKKFIKLKMQTPHVLDLIDEKSKEMKKKNPDCGEPAFLLNLKYMIQEIDGETPNPLSIDEFIENLPMIDTNFIIQNADKLNESVGIDVQLNNTCDVCGLDYTSFFRFTNEFFRPTSIA